MKKTQPKKKASLHARNPHRGRYDLKKLQEIHPEISAFVIQNKYGDESVNFADPKAVYALNKALLLEYYNLSYWDIPPGYLCPPIPGRADYIHHIADFLAEYKGRKVPQGPQVRCLDIGVGASCIYPIIGQREYGWHFTGSDIDTISIESAKKIVNKNKALKAAVEIRRQEESNEIFRGIIREGEVYTLCICNPPFHASAEDARKSTTRKLKNLNQGEVKKITLNFGGKGRELWCEGGEKGFVERMIRQSRDYTENCLFFSTLISRESNLNAVYKMLKKAEATIVKTIPMGQGNKRSRIVVWSFLRSC